MEDPTYWKSVALWMADVIATTGQRAVMLKSTPTSERERQALIATKAAAALEGTYRPVPRDAEPILRRLRTVAKMAEE